MVRAILDGRKTQTRRPLKPQPINLPDCVYCNPYNKNYEHFTFWTKENKMILGCGGNIKNTAHWRCPYGKPGDRLWVRETWQIFPFRSGNCAFEYKADCPNHRTNRDIIKMPEGHGYDLIKYRRDGWKPSIHMPRWASRITLEITEVRIEKVQDISEEDAKYEGAPNILGYKDMGWKDYRDWFKDLWNPIYGKTEYKWSNNPWVWTIDFKLNP